MSSGLPLFGLLSSPRPQFLARPPATQQLSSSATRAQPLKQPGHVSIVQVHLVPEILSSESLASCEVEVGVPSTTSKPGPENTSRVHWGDGPTALSRYPFAHSCHASLPAHPPIRALCWLFPQFRTPFPQILTCLISCYSAHRSQPHHLGASYSHLVILLHPLMLYWGEFLHFLNGITEV